MIKIIRTNSDNQDFIELVKNLDADLAERDGNDHSFYHQFNTIDKIKHAVIAYEDNKLVGCGAIKEFTPQIMEIKRMYTLPESRGKELLQKFYLNWKNGHQNYLTKNAYWKPEKDSRKRSNFIKRTDTKTFQTTDNTKELKIVFVSKKKSNKRS